MDISHDIESYDLQSFWSWTSLYLNILWYIHIKKQILCMFYRCSLKHVAVFSNLIYFLFIKFKYKHCALCNDCISIWLHGPSEPIPRDDFARKVSLSLEEMIQDISVFSRETHITVCLFPNYRNLENFPPWILLTCDFWKSFHQCFSIEQNS